MGCLQPSRFRQYSTNDGECLRKNSGSLLGTDFCVLTESGLSVVKEHTCSISKTSGGFTVQLAWGPLLKSQSHPGTNHASTPTFPTSLFSSYPDCGGRLTLFLLRAKLPVPSLTHPITCGPCSSEITLGFYMCL